MRITLFQKNLLRDIVKAKSFLYLVMTLHDHKVNLVEIFTNLVGQCPEPRLLNLESRTLTVRTLCLHKGDLIL